MEDLERAEELAPADQGHRAVGAEALAREHRAAAELGEGAQGGDGGDPAAEHLLGGDPLVGRQPVVGHRRGKKARAGGEGERVVGLVQEEHVGSVDLQLRRDVVEDDLEREPDVGAGADREAHGLQRGQAVEALDCVLVELGVLDRQSGPVGDRLRPVHVLLRERVRTAALEKPERADDGPARVHRHHEHSEGGGRAAPRVLAHVVADLVVEKALQALDRHVRQEHRLT